MNQVHLKALLQLTPEQHLSLSHSVLVKIGKAYKIEHVEDMQNGTARVSVRLEDGTDKVVHV